MNKDNLRSPVIFEDDDPKSSSKFIQNQNNGKKLIRPVQFEEKEKSTEEKIYIVLYVLNDIDPSDPSSKTYSVCIGRTSAYADIKTKLQEGIDIDIHRSIVLTETRQTETESGDIKYFMVPFKESISVYSFCVSVAMFYTDDEFDIEYYNDGDIPEDRMKDIGSPNFLSAEQIEYRKMLEESMVRDKFINDLRHANEGSNNV